MVNQQKGVQQDTAYSAVVMNDHMYPRACLYHWRAGASQPSRTAGSDFSIYIYI